MTRLATRCLLGSALLGTGVAQAAGADLSVKGKLLPAACQIALQYGGVFEHAILARELDTDPASPTSYTFTQGDIRLSIACATATKVAIRMRDNRAGSDFGGRLFSSEEESFPPNASYGLGMSGGRRIGEYFITLSEPRVEGVWATLMKSRPNGSWERLSKYTYLEKNDTLASFVDGPDWSPKAFSRAEVLLSATVTLNKVAELDLSREIVLDGSGTIELIYL